jgi:hypothetical protein
MTMSVVGSAEDAEAVAQDWLMRRHGKRFNKVKFDEIMLEGDVWTLKGQIVFRGGILAEPKQNVVIRISSETTQVVGYSEAKVE